jgi:DNA-binding NarL/FixJ family response regulator
VNRVTGIMTSEGKGKVRILIVDDNLFVRQQLRELLDNHPAWEVCGEGSDGVEAVRKTRELAPDIVVMDLSMPIMNWLRATHEIAGFAPALPIVMFSMYLSPHFTEAARQAGARGVVSKSHPQQIIQAVKALLSGQTFFRNDGNSSKRTRLSQE